MRTRAEGLANPNLKTGTIEVAAGALVIASSNPVSLGVIAPPGEWDADKMGHASPEHIGLLLLGLTAANDWDQPIRERRLDLQIHVGVGLFEYLPAFGMAQDHVIDIERAQHHRGHFAGERAFFLDVHVLGPEPELVAVRVDQGLDGSESCEWWAYDDLDPIDGLTREAHIGRWNLATQWAISAQPAHHMPADDTTARCRCV